MAQTQQTYQTEIEHLRKEVRHIFDYEIAKSSKKPVNVTYKKEFGKYARSHR